MDWSQFFSPASFGFAPGGGAAPSMDPGMMGKVAAPGGFGGMGIQNPNAFQMGAKMMMPQQQQVPAMQAIQFPHPVGAGHYGMLG